MTVRDMHYDFKVKFNKLDSQQNRNFLVPEIDWMLNEAQEVFIKAIAEPRTRLGGGFEIGQRTIDEIRTIVVDQKQANSTCTSVTKIDDNLYKATLPVDYIYHVGSKVVASKGICNKILITHIVQHDDEHETSVFDKSSFEWGECNIQFNEDGILIFTDGVFIPQYICLSYLRKPAYIQNAQDMPGATYTLPDNVTVLTGSQNCELPAISHRQVVDLAVLIASGAIDPNEYQIKQAKFKLSE